MNTPPDSESPNHFGIPSPKCNSSRDCQAQRSKRAPKFYGKDYTVNFSRVRVEKTDRLTRSSTRLDSDFLAKNFYPSKEHSTFIKNPQPFEKLKSNERVFCSEVEMTNEFYDRNCGKTDRSNKIFEIGGDLKMSEKVIVDNISEKRDIVLGSMSNDRKTLKTNANLKLIVDLGKDFVEFNPSKDLDQMLQTSIDPDKYLSSLSQEEISNSITENAISTYQHFEDTENKIKPQTFEFRSTLNQEVHQGQNKDLAILNLQPSEDLKTPEITFQNALDLSDQEILLSSWDSSSDSKSYILKHHHLSKENAQTIDCLKLESQLWSQEKSQDSSKDYARMIESSHLSLSKTSPQTTQLPSKIFGSITHQQAFCESGLNSTNNQQLHSVFERKNTQSLWDIPAEEFLKTDQHFSRPFSISGGSIERVFSPILKNGQTVLKYPGISIPFAENDVFLLNSSSSMKMENLEYEPKYKIELVDSPPPLRSYKPSSGETTSSKVIDEKQIFKSAMEKPKHSTMFKPKRGRRTRAEMEMYREEMARRKQNEKKTDMERYIPNYFNQAVDGGNHLKAKASFAECFSDRNMFLTSSQAETSRRKQPVSSCLKIDHQVSGPADIVPVERNVLLNSDSYGLPMNQFQLEHDLQRRTDFKQLHQSCNYSHQPQNRQINRQSRRHLSPNYSFQHLENNPSQQLHSPFSNQPWQPSQHYEPEHFGLRKEEMSKNNYQGSPRQAWHPGLPKPSPFQKNEAIVFY